MKLTQLQKSLVFELIAVGTRPIAIVREINKRLNPAKPFVKEQVSYYLKVFRGFSAEEQMAYLPHTMQESFARQEVRINSDIRQLQRTEERLNSILLRHDDFVQLSRLAISIKNRIGQELGQVRAMSKAGVGSLYLQQNIFTNYQRILDDATGLSEEDRADLYRKLKEEKDHARAIDVKGGPEEEG